MRNCKREKRIIRQSRNGIRLLSRSDALVKSLSCVCVCVCFNISPTLASLSFMHRWPRKETAGLKGMPFAYQCHCRCRRDIHVPHIQTYASQPTNKYCHTQGIWQYCYIANTVLHFSVIDNVLQLCSKKLISTSSHQVS